MMKNWISQRGWLASVVVLGLSVATAWADTTQEYNVYVPGVNSSGNLDGGFGTFLLPLKVSINTKTGTFAASGKGQVPNYYIGKKGKPEGLEFPDPPLKISLPDGVTVTSSLFKVDKKGKCKLEAAGYVGAAPPAPPAS